MSSFLLITGSVIMYYAGYIVKGDVDPCISSTPLPFMTQRVVGYTWASSDSPICDYYLNDGWYNFENFSLANTTIGCGTNYNWYMKGKLPAAGIANLTVCRYEGPDNKCSSSKTVQAKKCHDGRYVFYLVSVSGCSEAYCISSLYSTTGGAASAPDVSAMPKPKVVAEVQQIPIEKPRKNQLVFFCDISPLPSNSLFYVVEWSLTTGLSITNLIRQSVETKYVRKDDFRLKTSLTQHDLHNFGLKTLGFSLVCAVKVKDGRAGKFSNTIISDSKFCGVQVVNSNVITLKDDDILKIQLQLTIPFGCPMNTTSCQLIFSMYFPTLTTCSLSRVALKSYNKNTCNIAFLSTDVGKFKTFKITAAIGKNLDRRTRIFAVQLISIPYTAHPFFQNYSIDPIRVQLITNTKVLSGKKCYAHSDPHILTFDGMGYDNQNDGTFTLYRNTKNNVEVQIKTKKCPNYNPRSNKPWCTCAVAVRAGKDVFSINNCDNVGIADAKFVMCEDRVLQRKVKRDSTGRAFHVYLPTGTEVKLDHIWQNLIEVDIIPSVVDIKNTDGLCGSFDENKTNDRAHRAGSKEIDPNLSWKVPVEEVLFNRQNLHKLTHWEEEIYFCTCADERKNAGIDTQGFVRLATCDTSKQINCTDDSLKDVDNAMCSLKERKRRETAEILYDLDTHAETESELHINHTITPTFDLTLEIRKRSVYTDTTARQDCLRRMNTSTFQMCLSLPTLNVDDYVENCVKDAMMSNSMEWSLLHLEGLKKQCVHDAEVNQPIPENDLRELDALTEAANTTNITNGEIGPTISPVIPSAQNFNFTPALLDDIKSVSCPRECSGNGLCKEGICECDKGFIGADCAIDSTKPPEMIGIPDKGRCDIQQRKCGKTSVFGRNFVDIPTLSCRLLPFRVGENGSLVDELTHDISASMESFSEIKCDLPFQRTKRSQSLSIDSYVARGYKVSVSNDKKGYSAEDIIVIFDSLCVNCSKDAGNVICNIKPGFCMDMGRCYKFGERSGCYSCTGDNPERVFWTAGPDCPVQVIPQESPTKLWIIGAVLGPLVAIIIIVTFVVYCIRKNTNQRKEKQNAVYHEGQHKSI